MKRLTLFSLVLLVLVIPLVSSAPPITQVSIPGDTGLQVEVPTNAHVKEGEGVHLNIHVYNVTNGIPVGAKEGVNCYADLYNRSGEHIVDRLELGRDDIEFDWNISANNFTEHGNFPFVVTCNNSRQGGFFESTFEVTTSGEDEVVDNMPLTIILIMLGIVVLYFIVLIKMFAEREFSEHGFIKMLFYLTAFWVILLPLHISILFLDHYAGPEEVIELVEILFVVMTFLNYFITVYFVLWFLIQLLKKIGKSNNKLRLSNE